MEEDIRNAGKWRPQILADHEEEASDSPPRWLRCRKTRPWPPPRWSRGNKNSASSALIATQMVEIFSSTDDDQTLRNVRLKVLLRQRPRPPHRDRQQEVGIVSAHGLHNKTGNKIGNRNSASSAPTAVHLDTKTGLPLKAPPRVLLRSDPPGRIRFVHERSSKISAQYRPAQTNVVKDEDANKVEANNIV